MIRRCPGGRTAPLTVAAILSLLVGVPELSAQSQGPIKLFPNLGRDEAPAPAPDEVPERVPPGRGPGTEAAPARTQTSPDIRVQGLEAPELDAIGGPGGFDPRIWHGADPERVEALLRSLPLPERNRALAGTTRRLLLTGSLFDQGGRTGDVLAARLERLVAMGALDAAAALSGQLPANGVREDLAMQALEIALWRGEDEAACRRLAESDLPQDHSFFLKLQVHCRMLADDQAGAALALDLLRERGAIDDPRFLRLAPGGGAGEGASEAEQPLTALHVAMLRRAGEPLPPEGLDAAPPVLATVVATEPDLSPERARRFADAAFLRGAIDADRLRSLYQRDPPPAGDDLERMRSEPPDAARAALLAAAARDVAPEELARLFDILWSRSEPADRLLAAHLLAPSLARLQPGETLLFAAASVARAMLATGRYGLAEGWHDLLVRSSGDDASAREAAASLVPLMVIAGAGDGGDAPPEAGEEVWNGGAAWGGLVPLAEGAGVRVPLAVWADVPGNGGAPAAEPRGFIWRVEERAAVDGIEGERMLAALHLLGGAPRDVTAEAAVRGLRALGIAGHARDARAIALDAAILDGR